MKWFYAKGSQQLGPVDLEELQKKLLSGELSPTTLVWKEGMKDWAPAEKVKEVNLNEVLPPPLTSPAPTPGAETKNIFTAKTQTGDTNNSQPVPHQSNAQTFPVESQVGTGIATASMVLGIVGIIMWCAILPLNIILNPLGLILGIKAKKRLAKNHSKQTQATTGIVLNSISLGLMLILLVCFALAMTIPEARELLSLMFEAYLEGGDEAMKEVVEEFQREGGLPTN